MILILKFNNNQSLISIVRHLVEFPSDSPMQIYYLHWKLKWMIIIESRNYEALTSPVLQLPAEQLMPPELYVSPPPSIYSNPNRNPLNLAQMPELEPR